jgi:hypothetical protein
MEDRPRVPLRERGFVARFKSRTELPHASLGDILMPKHGDNPLDMKMPPLKITCTSVDCERNLHCFLKRKGMRVEDHGSCRACGAKLVDWPRLHRRDPKDTKNTFKSLKFETIRHHMWHVPFDEDTLRKAYSQGRTKLHADVASRLRSSIG